MCERCLRLGHCYYEIIWLDWRPDGCSDAPREFLAYLVRPLTLAYLQRDESCEVSTMECFSKMLIRNWSVNTDGQRPPYL